MNLQVNQLYHGFRLLEEKEIREINSIARRFEHEKSGAKLYILQNEDDNKVFSITFRTPPTDSTGLPHILEHAVLCGSRKYPVKEPFVELAKGSLNTFLNAFTFSDKTMYPVASKNDKDFRNLMDVYLDAVFYPNIYSNPHILKQEGWHYELESKEDEIIYKGVVYNEMKGAFSTPESVLFRKIQESLYPDTPYRYESGGDPDVIPELTQEMFIHFHRKYYHPSNSYIFLYGNVDILEQLQFLNDAYLKDFDRIEVDSLIPLQPPFTEPREMEVEYAITPAEKEEDKTFFSLNFSVGTSTNPEQVLAFDILEYMLLETPAAPLKKALIEADLGKDVFGAYDSSILQPTFSVVVKNSNLDKKERFISTVFAVLERLVQDGIDKKMVEAAINRKEFELREAETRGYPKGLFYNITCLESWLHDQDPAIHLEYEPILAKIKTALETPYFENLIRQFLINNNHRSLLIVKPKKGLAEEQAERIKQELAEYKASLTEQELDQLIQETKLLKEIQLTPDAQEALETIPLLSLNDIQREVEQLPLIVKEENGIKVLHHPVFTNRIAYVNLYFDTRGVEQELIPYIGLLTGILGKIDTEKRDYEELSNELNIYTGGISYSVETFTKQEDEQAFLPRLVVKSKALIDRLPKLFELLAEILGSTRYEDGKRVKEILSELKSRIEMSIYDRGHLVAASRALSYFSSNAKYLELVKGISFYQFVADLVNHFDEQSDVILSNLSKVASLIFNRNALLISVTCEEMDYEQVVRVLPILDQSLSNESFQPIRFLHEENSGSEGFLTSAKVQYVAKAFNFKRLGYAYSGSLHVLRTILGLDYLWNRVRVQGGAYGGMAGIERNGNIYFTSYRDPNLSETIEIYHQAAEYIRSFEASEREMTKYIIGTISRLDAPLSPSMKGEKATALYLSGISQEDLQQERDQVLSTKVEEIRRYADMIDQVMKQNCLCVLGNDEKIRS